MAKKAGDEWVVPLCRECHNNVHLVGSKMEKNWFASTGHDCERMLAKDLWDKTGDVDEMLNIVVEWTAW